MVQFNEQKQILDFLQQHQGRDFTSIGVTDESQGRWVQPGRILNKHLVRHIKTALKVQSTTGDIGAFVYHDARCQKLLTGQDFWFSKKGQRCFWYAWV